MCEQTATAFANQQNRGTRSWLSFSLEATSLEATGGVLFATLMLAALCLPASATAQDFEGDDNGDGIIVLDAFEDGIQTDPDEYVTFAGGGASISLAESDDVPSESSGSTALDVTVEGGEGGGFVGYIRGTGSDAEVNGVDVSDLGEDPYFTMYIKSDATEEYTLEIQLEEDQDGNGSYDPDGVDDEFQYDLTVSPNSSGYEFISIPLSDFSDDGDGGDGTLSNRIANFVPAIGGLPAETFTFTLDDVGFTDEGGPIPVELAGFDVRADGSDALLKWQTASETQNARFEVQVASGESPFRTVGSVRGAGTTTEAQDYQFRVTDLTPGTHRFRLRQVDLDGTTTLSDVQTLSLSMEAPFTMIQPTANPVRSGQTATLKYAVQDREPVQVELYNLLGQRVQVLRDEWSTPGAVTTVRIPTTDLTSGRYFVRITGRSFSETETISVVR